MNVNRVHEILRMTTRPFRKGPAVVQNQASTAYFAMPHVDTAAPNLRKVDVHYIVVTVDQDVAETLRAELLELLKQYPGQRLQQGPSYIEVGAMLDSHEAAFKLFALGEVLGLWRVVTPATVGMDGDTASIFAGLGLVTINGFQPSLEEA